MHAPVRPRPSLSFSCAPPPSWPCLEPAFEDGPGTDGAPSNNVARVFTPDSVITSNAAIALRAGLLLLTSCFNAALARTYGSNAGNPVRFTSITCSAANNSVNSDTVYARNDGFAATNSNHSNASNASIAAVTDIAANSMNASISAAHVASQSRGTPNRECRYL